MIASIGAGGWFVPPPCYPLPAWQYRPSCYSFLPAGWLEQRGGPLQGQLSVLGWAGAQSAGGASRIEGPGCRTTFSVSPLTERRSKLTQPLSAAAEPRIAPQVPGRPPKPFVLRVWPTLQRKCTPMVAVHATPTAGVIITLARARQGAASPITLPALTNFHAAGFAP